MWENNRLEDNDKKKLEQRINELIENLRSDAKDKIHKGMSDKQVIDYIINVTVNKVTAESKTLLSSIYYMMEDQTLAKPLYNNAQNKAAFYKRDIFTELNNKFDFNVPDNIDDEESKNKVDKWIKAVIYERDIYKELKSKFDFNISDSIDDEENKNKINKWVKAGAIVVSGGIISIPLNNCIPLGIAAVIAGIMTYLSKSNIDCLIDEYLDKVKNFMILWINSIVKYYDASVKELEGKLDSNGR